MRWTMSAGCRCGTTASAGWEQEHGQPVYVMLSATKDVQDAILRDPRYRKEIDFIDIRQWSRTADGSLYAPEGCVAWLSH